MNAISRIKNFPVKHAELEFKKKYDTNPPDFELKTPKNSGSSRVTFSSAMSQKGLQRLTSKIARWLPWGLLLLSFMPFIKDQTMTLNLKVPGARYSTPVAHTMQGSESQWARSSGTRMQGGGELVRQQVAVDPSTPSLQHEQEQDEEQQQEGAEYSREGKEGDGEYDDRTEQTDKGKEDEYDNNSHQQQQDNAQDLEDEAEEGEAEEARQRERSRGRPREQQRVNEEEDRTLNNLPADAVPKPVSREKTRLDKLKARQEQLLRIQKGVEAAEKKLCKPVQLKGQGWRMMCSEKAYQQIRLEKKRLQEEQDWLAKEREKEKESKQVRMQESTFKTVAGSAALWQRMMGASKQQERDLRSQRAQERGEVTHRSVKDRVQQDKHLTVKRQQEAQVEAEEVQEDRPVRRQRIAGGGEASGETTQMRLTPASFKSQHAIPDDSAGGQVRSRRGVGGGDEGLDHQRGGGGGGSGVEHQGTQYSRGGGGATLSHQTASGQHRRNATTSTRPHREVELEWDEDKEVQSPGVDVPSAPVSTLASAWGTLTGWVGGGTGGKKKEAATSPAVTQGGGRLQRNTSATIRAVVRDERGGRDGQRVNHTRSSAHLKTEEEDEEEEEEEEEEGKEESGGKEKQQRGGKEVEEQGGDKVLRLQDGIAQGKDAMELPFSWRKSGTVGHSSSSTTSSTKSGLAQATPGGVKVKGGVQKGISSRTWSPPSIRVLQKTPDPLDDSRWAPLSQLTGLPTTIENGHCSSHSLLEPLKGNGLDEQDMRYISTLWRTLEEYATEGLKYRVNLKNVTMAHVVKPIDPPPPPVDMEALKAAITRGRKKKGGGSSEPAVAQPPPPPLISNLNEIIAGGKVDLDAILDVLNDRDRRRRRRRRATSRRRMLSTEEDEEMEEEKSRVVVGGGVKRSTKGQEEYEDEEAKEIERIQKMQEEKKRLEDSKLSNMASMLLKKANDPIKTATPPPKQKEAESGWVEEDDAAKGSKDDPLKAVREAAAGAQAKAEADKQEERNLEDALTGVGGGLPDNETEPEDTHYETNVEGVDPDQALQNNPIPLTTHRMQFFPADYWDPNQLKYCPHVYRQKGTPCKPWERRLPRLEELDSELKVSGLSVRTGDQIRVEPLAYSHLNFKKEIIQVLPMEDVQWKFESCAVIGNSGVLHDSKQGKNIDAHQAVLRTNMAPTEGFEDDVGSRTTFDVINLQHSKAFTPRVRAGGQDAESIRAPLRNSTLIVFEVINPFARHHVYAPLLRRFNSKASTSGTRVAVLSPELVMHVHRLWFATKTAIEIASHEAKFTKTQYQLKPMSGFFATIFSLQVCKRVTLYGFSSYHPKHEGAAAQKYSSEQMRYHYFDAVAGVTRHHSFDLAFEMLNQMSKWPCSNTNLSIVS